MSRTVRGHRAPGFEYWKPRPLSGFSPSRGVKRLTHHRERAMERALERLAMEDGDVAAADGPRRSPCRPR